MIIESTISARTTESYSSFLADLGAELEARLHEKAWTGEEVRGFGWRPGRHRHGRGQADNRRLAQHCEQMLSALDYLTCNDLCHRDVKPENILYWTNPGGDYTFQLADFGLANYRPQALTMCGISYYHQSCTRSTAHSPRAPRWTYGPSLPPWPISTPSSASRLLRPRLTLTSCVLFAPPPSWSPTSPTWCGKIPNSALTLAAAG